MIVEKCAFDPMVDKTPVSNIGFVDLKSAFVNHALPSQIAEGETDYNGIEDPASIMGRPTDVFEALEMQSHINSVASESNDGSRESE